MSAFIQRFADPETERAYPARRAGRARLGDPGADRHRGATLLSYIVLNPMHFPREGVIAYNQAAGALIAAMVGLFALTRTRFYLRQAVDRSAGLRRHGGGDEMAGGRARRPLALTPAFRRTSW